jgi:hypothetical protein
MEETCGKRGGAFPAERGILVVSPLFEWDRDPDVRNFNKNREYGQSEPFH